MSDPADRVRPARSADAASAADEAASFGFRTVSAAGKASLVRGVFDSVAPRYDLMNDLMSLGVHRLWKTALVDALDPRPGTTILDVGGGTGDIALRILDRVDRRGGGDGETRPCEVVVCDVNAQMLCVGRDRALDRGRLDRPAWVCGDAERLPFPDRSADACTIAFALRNVTRIDAALAEMRRVLKPGGRMLCLEFSHVAVPLLAEAYEGYSFRVLPLLGRLVAGDRDAYQYLVESIRRFPPQEELAARMASAGFERVSWRNMSGGIVALHSGWRL
ncbi:MAG: class I SAM-dependent methyltransferase [Alphaproteobacteria bacterium]